MLVEGTKQTPIEAKLMKDGKALPLKDVEIIVGEDKITFKIKKPQHDQSGVYQVKISNGQGEEVKDVFVNMQGIEDMIFSFINIYNQPKANNNIILFYRGTISTT